MPDNEISTIEELEELYGAPVPRALIKEIDYISDHYRAFIESSPFVIIASIEQDVTSGMLDDKKGHGDPDRRVHRSHIH